MNIYKDCDFFEFLILFFKRLHLVLKPSLLLEDELQIFTLIFTGSTCILVALFLLLQKKMMIANSISHTILLGIVVCLAFIRMTQGSDFVFDYMFSIEKLIVPAMISAFLTHYLTDFLIKKMNVQEDASIGMIFTFLFALSVFLVSFMGRNSHLGLEAITGNIDAVNILDLSQSFYVFLVTSFWIYLFLPFYKLISFDLGYSKTIGVKIAFFDLVLMFLCSFALIIGFKSVGVVMILGLMTFPLLTARLLAKSIHRILIFALILNAVYSIFSVALSRSLLSSYNLPISTSGVLVTLSGLGFFFVIFLQNRLLHIRGKC